MSLPLTKDANGLPIGLQVIAPAFHEEVPVCRRKQAAMDTIEKKIRDDCLH